MEKNKFNIHNKRSSVVGYLLGETIQTEISTKTYEGNLKSQSIMVDEIVNNHDPQ